MEFHHKPDEEAQLLPEPVKGMLLGRIVFAADAVVHHLGIHVISTDGPQEPSRENALATLEALGFSSSALKILETFDTEYEAIRSFF